MQLDYFIPSDSLTLFEAGQRFFIEELDLELNSVTAQPVPARAFLHGYADTTPALGKVRDIYFLGQLNDQALAENAARRRGQVNLKTPYAEVQPPTAGRAYPGLALFALDLTQAPTRGEVAELTRTFNRASNFLPVLLLLRYPAPATGAGDAGVRLALAASERLEYVQTWRPGEKVGKVTTLFDIDPRPDRLHTGHQQILQRLRVPTDVDTLRGLSQHWNRVLSVQVLNESFYRELSNWYFWAVRQVQTPAAAGDTTENDHEVRHATALIRLITRLVFTWFLKEKNLVPAKLFDEAFVYGAAGPLLEKPADPEQSSNYYKAVLQNLFFATLNTEMRDQENKPNRQFLPNKKYGNPGFGEAGYLRYESFFTKAGRGLALDLFNRVPFLNGGLFECLDPTPPKGQARAERELIDCFSNEHHAKLLMPDYLFFGPERVTDLSGDYGDKARKREKVRGLLRILKAYTFTITENTPLEEEVALDPELLGKVFENLLAAYNPETKTTARKQTGSFYTPREVVEYMVDESLLAYLRPFLPIGPVAVPALAQVVDQPNQTLFGQAIPQQATLGLGRPAPAAAAPDAEAALRHLLAMPDAPNPFNPTDTWRLIDALDRFKLLDPACGSGAFPMGALQRLTYLLARLDPNNRHWKQLQLLRAKADHQTALTFQDAEVKKQAVAAAKAREKEIEVAFDTNNHELDYGRKLYLIENCLYGVDIQPVAVQITKLRCFIALLVEQKATAALAAQPERNLGIRPLPNLETKFVAANTLLRLDEEAAANARRDQGAQMGLVQMDNEIDGLRQQLREVRHEYFTVRGRADKLALKDRDAKLREQLGKTLKRSLPGPDAEKIANWNPYDLRKSAAFFSPKWMLGVDDGFDVVIGNPPYVQVPKRVYSALSFPYSEGKDPGKQNLYKVFVEASYNFLKPNGNACLIVQSSLMCDLSSKHTRELLLTQTQLHLVLEFPKVAPNIAGQVFEGVLQGTCVYISKKIAPEKDHEFMLSVNNDVTTMGHLLFESVKQTTLLTIYPTCFYIPLIKPGEFEVMQNMTKMTLPLSKHALSITQGDLNLAVNSSAFSENKTPVKLYRGRNIHRFHLIKECEEWVNINFSSEKVTKNKASTFLVCQEVTGTVDRYRLHFTLTDPTEKFLFGHTANKIELVRPNLLKVFLGILNSRLLDWFFRKTSTNNHVMGYELEQLPIAKMTKKDEEAIETLVAKILAAKAADATADTTALEVEIDRLVYQSFPISPCQYCIPLLSENKQGLSIKPQRISAYRGGKLNGRFLQSAGRAVSAGSPITLLYGPGLRARKYRQTNCS